MPLGWAHLVDMIPDYWEISGHDEAVHTQERTA